MKPKSRFFRKPASSTKEATNVVTSKEVPTKDTLHLPTPIHNTNKSLNYRTRFMKEPGVKARTGKLVYVRKEYHERILRIIQVIGENDASLYGFLDNIIAEHFALHKEEILELYNESYKPVF